ncbi:MAG TPA: hypothetical protein VJ508_09195, partial [Saprospiraceae bacterium]|nr:hypothetical protein [Saprospiraceae bacterium]
MNHRLAVFGVAFLIGIFMMVGTLQGISRATGTMTFNSPVSVTPIPRQGVASALFPGNQPTLTQLATWVAGWTSYNGTY